MQSIRGVGYDTRSAVADIVDNSIAAGAAIVQVAFRWSGRESTVTILDDGCGMDQKTLETAMTLGSWNPAAERAPSDLGRFGLGLKTASLSQCSRLVVASKPLGATANVLVWDLEAVAAADDWVVTDQLLPREAALLSQLERLSSGTLVIWSALDRLVGDRHRDDGAARLHFQRVAADVEAHLAMVFHRFLEGRQPRLRLYLNGSDEEQRVSPWDPFCLAQPAAQQMVETRRTLGTGTVTLQGHVLPHKDRFGNQSEFEKAGGPEGWTAQQGFYVYRGQRLLLPGSWLGLGAPRRWARDEQHKLARIRLDIPNSLDAEWLIDVKKSRANPPLELRDWLTRNASQIRAEAREVFVHRGNRASSSSRSAFCPTWFADVGPSPRYRINREHPAVSALLSVGSPKATVESVLRLLEATVPIHRIWLDVAEKPEVPQTTSEQLTDDIVTPLARDMLSRLMKGGELTRQAALARLRLVEPFDQFPQILAALEHE